MSILNKLINYLPGFTDQERSGGERCPYCGNLHFSQAEMDACARAYSSHSEGPYRCNRCGQFHTTLEAANHCCEEEKRYESQYDQNRYNGYTYGGSGYGTGYGYGSGQQQQEEEDPYNSGESIFDSIFNAGGSGNQSQSNNSGGGLLDSFLNAGGSSNDNNNNSGGGGFWPWE